MKRLGLLAPLLLGCAGVAAFRHHSEAGVVYSGILVLAGAVGLIVTLMRDTTS